jgi:hypothetical protein
MEKKTCIRCERLIDPFARICPFCNWDQELPAPGESRVYAQTAEEDQRDPAAEERWQRRKRILVAAGIVALLIATFAVGSIVARLGRKPQTPQEETPNSAVQTPVRDSGQLTDLRLVPVDLTSTVGGSITSVPMQPGTATDAGGSASSDATALPSQQYSDLVRRSVQQPLASGGMGVDTLDPRTIVAPPIPQIRRPAPPAPRPAPSAAPDAPAPDPGRSSEGGGSRTRPEPISQPLPDINVDGTARFRLRVGADGKVNEVEVLQSIPGATPRLISAIQRWRFKPATENGRPVEGVHLVDVSFKARHD